MKTVILTTIVLVLLLSLAGCGVSDGAFRQAEYQIKFEGLDGKPIEDIRLEVQDKGGSISYGYPVTDYYADSIPVSDANGMIVFHHVTYFFEWGGVFFFGWSDVSVPEFNLRFIKSGELIHETKYNDLDRKVNVKGPMITRKVSVFDKETARAAWKHDQSDYPIHIVEEVMQFTMVEQTVIVH